MVAIVHYLLALLAACSFTTVLASPARSPTHTLGEGGEGRSLGPNAQRLARGLPALKPGELFVPSGVRRQLPESGRPPPILSTGSVGVLERSDNGDEGLARGDGDGGEGVRGALVGRGLETNAQRMKRGLPPLRPKNLFIPSRVRRALPSGLPVLSGRIRVLKRSDNSNEGFMLGSGDVIGQATSSGMFQFKLPASPSELLEFNSVETAGQRIILYADPAKFPAGGNEYIAPGYAYRLYAALSTLSIPAGTKPIKRVEASLRKILYPLSTIWMVDRNTGAVSVQWVNYDGVTANVFFLLQTTDSGKSIVFTGDIAAYRAANPTLTLEEVVLTVAVD
ncbi:hypothetical protein DFP72DRAFT_1150215 [Ephemerocybe angulata]|uniref:Uncharacterized protein n=1 Tax=Ephemerocybe angulata TaxID=980116 RepID=A0A8H6HID9_9AGAR|nr:hypothetical protein DFP72DRAFT_1150215 [Tulosesus angulatus]